MVTIILKLIQL